MPHKLCGITLSTQLLQLCNACKMKYNFIGRLESFDSDLSLLMEKLNPEVKTAKVNFDAVNNHVAAKNSAITSNDQLKTKTTQDWFSHISCKRKKSLLRFYQPDYDFFNYTVPSWMNC